MPSKQTMENLGNKFAEVSIQYRWLIIIATIAISVAISYGAANLKFAPDYRVFFGAENPDFIANEKAQDTFGRPDNVAFLIIPKDGELFTPEHIAAVHELTQASWRLPYVSRVDSLTDFQNTRGETDDLIVEDLLFDAGEINDKKLAEMKLVAQWEPLLNGFVVSKDGKATLINAVIQAPNEIPNIASTIAQSARDFSPNPINKPSISFTPF